MAAGRNMGKEPAAVKSAARDNGGTAPPARRNLPTTYERYIDLFLLTRYVCEMRVPTAARSLSRPSMPQDEPVPDGETPKDAAAYIAELSAGLSSVARRHRLGTLVYILDMARMEAEILARARDVDGVSAG
jgi:hypothetical protein